MPRLNVPDPKAIPEDVRQFLANFPPDQMFTMLSHSNTTIQPLLGLARALYTTLELPVRARELAILALADLVSSDFVWNQHVPISGDAGIGDDVRRLIRDRDYRNSALSDVDSVVIRFSAAVVTRPRVPDDLFAEARAHLSEREIVELLHVIGYYWTFSRMSTVLDAELTHVYASEYGSSWD
ncbi:carboxymuconolactone decarboxylase family protein [Saccharopolyspora sp. 5N708]|uniref:carboxymuconolactone decarboxylase family protein n=1 Tax=Saccharopolyspora sp. 5N708 TaxID=3457424 RepID=UPI003FD13B7F